MHACDAKKKFQPLNVIIYYTNNKCSICFFAKKFINLDLVQKGTMQSIKTNQDSDKTLTKTILEII